MTANPDHLIMKVLLTVLALAAVAHASLSVNYNDPQDKCEFSDRAWQSGWGMELTDLLTFRTCQKSCCDLYALCLSSNVLTF